MIIKVDTIKEMLDLKAQSEYIHYEVADIDSDKASTLMHIYNMPDICWEVKELIDAKLDNNDLVCNCENGTYTMGGEGFGTCGICGKKVNDE